MTVELQKVLVLAALAVAVASDSHGRMLTTEHYS